ncbi:SHOCT domain-containing protein [Pengzhenrongella sicca]|uniref:SHOCT domain-containing protein n=1 Tax=Pengzhenrongella sicca TaxID=2819238 RepID=A0A8A4ZD80_9MICO|nr:SHOCT domain-containing protein [Pengzhenrongella sicca]QTE28979.1 SHOCT domain-containing protein [Pengzhenrongella sicca]
MSFLDVVWFIVISFAFVAYLMVMLSIVADIFRDNGMGGLAKALWVVALIFLPFLTAIVYLISHGDGMAERKSRELDAIRTAQESYIREVSGATASPVDQLAKAKALLDAGALSPAEFEALKAKVLV